MPLSDGDIVLVDYSIFVKGTGELVETTSEAVAKLHRKYREGVIYEPEVVVVGEGRLVRGFEEALRNAEIGKEYEIEVPPEKAYGERDSSKVKTYSRRLFLRNNIIPEIGKEVRINNQVGRIIAVEAGRVVVDFNHPLAGKTLIIKFKVVKKIEDIAEKIKYLLKRRIKELDVNKIKVEVKDDKVTIELPKEFRLADGIQLIKLLTSRDITKWIKGISEITFIDRFLRSEFEGGTSGESGEETTRG
ncbi:MAG: peptidylprolyl isomerase [Thermoprotei archaeon]|nr:MAG: peptidylprolyl isomerase [Thermoprotei archaeon]